MGNTGLPSHPPSVPVNLSQIGPSSATRARPGGLVRHHNVERSMLPLHLLYEDNVGDQRLTRELPMVRCKIMELTHLMRDTAHLEDYHARVHRQMSREQRAWLAERVPRIGEGTYSCWDGVWRTKNEIDVLIVQVRGELLSTGLWMNGEALDLFVLITAQ